MRHATRSCPKCLWFYDLTGSFIDETKTCPRCGGELSAPADGEVAFPLPPPVVNGTLVTTPLGARG